MADEEAFLVVVGVDEPGGDVLFAAGADFAGFGVEDVNAENLDDDLAVVIELPHDIGFTKDDEQVPCTGVFQLLRHMKVGVHLGFQDRQGAKFCQFRCVRIEIKTASNERIETGVERFTGCRRQIGSGDSSEFGTDENASAFFCFALHVAAFGGNVSCRASHR